MGGDGACVQGGCPGRRGVFGPLGGVPAPRPLPMGLLILPTVMVCSRFLFGIIQRQGAQLARQRNELDRLHAAEQRLRGTVVEAQAQAQARLKAQVGRLLPASGPDAGGGALQDDALQILYAVILDLELAAEDAGLDPDGARGRIDRSIDHVSGVIEGIRPFVLGPVPAG